MMMCCGMAAKSMEMLAVGVRKVKAVSRKMETLTLTLIGKGR
jgi:hypothetical protein